MTHNNGLTKSLYFLRVIAGFVTVIMVVGYNYAPKRHVQVFPSEFATINLFSDSQIPILGEYGNSSARWLSREQFRFECVMSEGARYRVCGASIKFHMGTVNETVVETLDNGDMRRMDISSFDGIDLDIEYEGQANKIRTFVRDQHATGRDKPAQSHVSEKYMYSFIHPEQYNTRLTIALDELRVADWWVDQHDIRSSEARSTFNNVVEVSVDLPASAALGTHRFQINSVTLVGKWAKAESVYLAIIAMWIVVLILETVERSRRAYVDRRNLAKLERNNKRLSDQAYTDELTGLHNRRGLEHLIDRIDTKAGAYYSVIVLDIDLFKAINDTHGHVAGDAVLTEFADIMRGCCRENDICARWGGEEFLVLTRTTNDDLALAERIRLAVADNLFLESSLGLHMTISAGISRMRDNESFQAAFERADKALYLAKRAGRNCAKVAS